MATKTVDVVAYDENWPCLFLAEKELLTDIFGDNVVRIEHFGSTSVPGLAGKPIIDIFVIVHDAENTERCNETMKSHGYLVRGEEPSGCKVFNKFTDDFCTRTHKVNVCDEGNQFSINALLFRDFLRINQEVCHQYENLKKELSRKYHNDPIAYGNGKHDFVMEIIEEAQRYFQTVYLYIGNGDSNDT